MSQPYLSQISTFAFGLIPKGWEACNGQLLLISDHTTLFNLIGSAFGGDGQTTFGLPDLRGRVPLGMYIGGRVGLGGGEVSHTLTPDEMPQHIHSVVASSLSTNLQSQPEDNFPAAPTNGVYAASANTTLGDGSSPSGNDQPHQNMQPYLAVQYCIAVQGVYPS